MEEGSSNGIILGDSGYPLRSWLFTPIRNPQTTTEERFNRWHRIARVIVEQAFGRLKMAWRVLHNECRLDPGMLLVIAFNYCYHLEKFCKIATICAMLHNIRIGTRLLINDDFNDVQLEEDETLAETPTPLEVIQVRRNYVINNCN